MAFMPLGDHGPSNQTKKEGKLIVYYTSYQNLLKFEKKYVNYIIEAFSKDS